MNNQPELIVIGGGLAGSEAAWQAAQRGIKVVLFEMRPQVPTGAHTSGDFAELVCSNSLGSKLVDRPSGMLKEEMRCLQSMLLECAEETAIPAGGALAVGREAFSQMVTKRIAEHPNIRIVREEVKEVPNLPAIIASGPLTSEALSRSILSLTGGEHLFFFDAIAPIVARETINMNIAYRASRYDRGEQDEGDYINCPFTQEEYDRFVEELIVAERIEMRSFEQDIQSGVQAGSRKYFEGCLPVEVIARRGQRALAYGPMRPVGLQDKRNGRWPYAAVQLRQDNIAGSLYNLVGFQTNLTYSEQKRVFRLIPGLEQAEFVRYGQMHRNTFIASPRLLEPTLQFRGRQNLFFAGQITGVEGYMGNIATGLLAGWNAARLLQGKPVITLPVTCMLGALCRYITKVAVDEFQPMKANFGILPPLELTNRMSKFERKNAYSHKGIHDLQQYISKLP
ncbi:MAG: methylenetetrahydrofolate--tRNA-(uracil(54)-C(5))-methyltransferase (FADH(2)-oxidizing) TrmFO [Anaerolineaceae bacterium]|nr:methylenetetrahydrofolate--tRNA-(uracil(54)-C(5))-methyltransferase (FADH(2)-oxidizing) TrmFO [Anaerolineaceae bacterium]